MAIITSYSTLQTAITDYLSRSDLSGFAPNFTQNWEERLYREPQNWVSWMETAFNVAISANLAAVPSNYLGTKVAYISGQSAPIERVSLTQLVARYPRGAGTAGNAKYMARDGSNFRFGPEVVSGTLVGTYYAKPTVMRSYTTGGADAAAHPIIVNAPDLALYGSLMEAEPFIKNDPRLATWGSLYQQALAAYRARYLEEEYNHPFMVAV